MLGQGHKFAKVPLCDLLYMRTKYLCQLNGNENISTYVAYSQCSHQKYLYMIYYI